MVVNHLIATNRLAFIAYSLLHCQKMLVLQEHGKRLVIVLNDQSFVEFP